MEACVDGKKITKFRWFRREKMVGSNQSTDGRTTNQNGGVARIMSTGLSQSDSSESCMGYELGESVPEEGWMTALTNEEIQARKQESVREMEARRAAIMDSLVWTG